MDTGIKTRLKRDDQVTVIAGKDKGKSGRVLRVDRKTSKVLVEGVNIVKKAMRKKRENDRGGIIEIEAPIHISNVMLLTKSGKPSRIGYRVENGVKTRIAKKTGEQL
ncbi:MAG: 50S ribosomal protein L24 [Spirochaetaceae bacterium]|nr:MAG: 50S ribosomal protein L24 [Spirochaetaceae bacterium]